MHRHGWGLNIFTLFQESIIVHKVDEWIDGQTHELMNGVDRWVCIGKIIAV
jgi:hypothetical protein